MALLPEHIVVLALMAAVGGGITVIVTDAVCGWLQAGVAFDAMLTRVIIVVDKYVPVNVAVPEAFSTIVWFGLLPT